MIRRIFQNFANGVTSHAIALQLNAEGVPGPGGRLWSATTIRGHQKRGTGLVNNELYISRLIWNRQRYVKNPTTGRRVAHLNPPQEWITKTVHEMAIVSPTLWQAVPAVNAAAVRGGSVCLNRLAARSKFREPPWKRQF